MTHRARDVLVYRFQQCTILGELSGSPDHTVMVRLSVTDAYSIIHSLKEKEVMNYLYRRCHASFQAQ
jgi:hypothetical protein